MDDGLNDVEIGAEYSWVKRFRSATIRGQKTSGAAAFASSESWRGRFSRVYEFVDDRVAGLPIEAAAGYATADRRDRLADIA